MDFINTQNVRGLNNLELLASQVVEGFIIGLHKSPFHGFSVEFSEHRLYNPGESTKNMDWKVYARTDKMFVKRYEEETNLRCQILLDISSSMNFPVVKSDSYLEHNKLRFSALAAASLMNLLRKQRDAYGLSLFDEEIRVHTGCKIATSHYRLLLSQLEEYVLNNPQSKKSSVAESMHHIAESIHRRSLVMIFSDMFDNRQDLAHIFDALKHLKYNKHEVVIFHTVDKSLEIEFEFENRPYEFIDLETGDRVRLQSNQVKEKYQSDLRAYQESIRAKCLQYRIDYVECDIRAGYNKILQSYLVKRSKMST